MISGLFLGLWIAPSVGYQCVPFVQGKGKEEEKVKEEGRKEKGEEGQGKGKEKRKGDRGKGKEIIGPDNPT